MSNINKNEQNRRISFPDAISRFKAHWLNRRCLRPVLAVGAVVFAYPSHAGPLQGQSADYFPIGVFYQPAVPNATTSFAGWAGRGVNTLVGFEHQSFTVTIPQYDAAATAAGLKVIREATDNPATDNNPNLVAWMLPHADEPEDNPSINPLDLQAQYASLKAIKPTKPILMNFDGSHMMNNFGGVTWATPFSQATYAPYMAAADWVAQDVYPVTGWLHYNALGAPGYATTTLKSYSGNKPSFAYIETSNQRLFNTQYPEFRERGVTPPEFRAEVWDAIIHGSRGIFYFPQMLTAFQYDGTPIDVAMEMTKSNAMITGLARALNSDNIPDVSTVNFSAGSMEYSVKSVNGVTYVIALNMSPASISTTMRS